MSHGDAGKGEELMLGKSWEHDGPGFSDWSDCSARAALREPLSKRQRLLAVLRVSA
jgi:hypothetical protein